MQNKHFVLYTERTGYMSGTERNDFIAQLRLKIEQMTLEEAIEVVGTRMNILTEKDVEHVSTREMMNMEDLHLFLLPTEDDVAAVMTELTAAMIVLTSRMDDIEKIAEIFNSSGIPHDPNPFTE